MLSPPKRPRVDRDAVMVPTLDQPSTSAPSTGQNLYDDGHFVFGDTRPSLPKDRLWTKMEVLNYIRFLKKQHSKPRFSSTELNKLYQNVAKEMLPVFHEAYLPTFNLEYSTRILRDNIEFELDQVRTNKSRLMKKGHIYEALMSRLKTFYQFSLRCQCFAKSSTPDEISRSACKCQDYNKIPALEFYKGALLEKNLAILHFEEDKEFFRNFMEGKCAFQRLKHFFTRNL